MIIFQNGFKTLAPASEYSNEEILKVFKLFLNHPQFKQCGYTDVLLVQKSVAYGDFYIPRARKKI